MIYQQKKNTISNGFIINENNTKDLFFENNAISKNLDIDTSNKTNETNW